MVQVCVQVGVVKVGLSGAGMCTSGVVKVCVSGAGMCTSGCDKSGCEWCRYVYKWV